jgi:hypothetical protein
MEKVIIDLLRRGLLVDQAKKAFVVVGGLLRQEDSVLLVNIQTRR